MVHEEYRRVVPYADTAVLLIHGILGTPNHFSPFLPLIPAEYTVHNLLLKGHGGSVRDFSRASMTAWETQVAAALAELMETHKKVYIVAHSLGTLLALEQASHVEGLAGMFLLAVPLRLFLRPALVKTSLKVWLNRIRPGDAWGLAARDCCSITQERNLLRYCGWVPRFLELFQKIRQVRKVLPGVQAPCRVYLSRKDEMVSPRSARLLACNSRFLVQFLEESGHFYYPPQVLSHLQTEFSKFIK